MPAASPQPATSFRTGSVQRYRHAEDPERHGHSLCGLIHANRRWVAR